MSTPVTQIPVARPLLGEREAEATRRVVMSGWVSQGPEVAAFEKEFARTVGAPFACAVSNCTTALHLALLAVGVRPGDEVVTVSHSFIASANAIRYCGGVPVFVDIEEQGFNIDPELIEQAISPKTRAILCVHQLGMPCDLRRVVELARRHGIPVVEDAACAMGSEILWQGEWQKIGRPHGDIACFSFHPRKVVTTGEGGMLTTRESRYDELFRLWRQHGMNVPDTVRHSSKQVIFEEYDEVGFNYRMTDLQAAIGREQIIRLRGIIETRRRLARTYTVRLSLVEGLSTPAEPEWAHSNWQSYCVGLPHGVDQHAVMQGLLDRGISTRRGVMNCHLEGAYAAASSHRVAADLRRSERARDSAIMLPMFAQMTANDINDVAVALEQVLPQARDLVA